LTRERKIYRVALLSLAAVLALASTAQVASAQPDLVIRGDVLASQWVVRDERLDATFCSVVEGGITPGDHRLLRFTVMAANLGDTDINIGDPRVHFAANDGLYELSTCHNHFHFRNYTLDELVDPASGKIWRAAKRGFCMLDTDPVPDSIGSEPPRNPQFRSCGTLVDPGNQGISHGWSDTYRFFLGGQYFLLDGGDGQDVVPPGDYIIRITVNPPYRKSHQEPCRFLDAATGLCHALEESNYANNQVIVPITIPTHPGRSGSGPAAGANQPNGEPAEH